MRSAHFSVTLLLLVLLPMVSVVASQGLGLHSAAGQSATTLTILTTTRTYYSGLVKVDGTDSNPGTNPPCGWTYLTFYATKGQHVSLSLESKGPLISFYVMSYSVRKNWNYQGHPVLNGTPEAYSPCHGAPSGSFISQDGIKSYTIRFDFPANDTYWFWFINIDRSHNSFEVNFSLLGSPTVLTSTTVLVASQSITSTSQLITSTVATTTPSQTGSQIFGSMPSSNLAMIGMGAIVAAVAALILARRRKAATTVVVQSEAGAEEEDSKTPLPESPGPRISTGYGSMNEAGYTAKAVAEETKGDSDRKAMKREPGTKLCPICKNLLPDDAVFCDECGTRVNLS